MSLQRPEFTILNKTEVPVLEWFCPGVAAFSVCSLVLQDTVIESVTSTTMAPKTSEPNRLSNSNCCQAMGPSWTCHKKTPAFNCQLILACLSLCQLALVQLLVINQPATRSAPCSLLSIVVMSSCSLGLIKVPGKAGRHVYTNRLMTKKPIIMV